MRSGGGPGAAARTSAPPTTPRKRPRSTHRDNPDAYIAGDRRRALGEGRDLPDRVTGAAIFADISGFTPLTEALAAELGAQRGAEELTAVLDVVFDAVLDELHRFGGSVIYFSGDAVTCWIDGDDGLLAISCALGMQRAIEGVSRITTPGGTNVELGMKVAVAVGSARRFVVGDPDIQLIDVLAGSLMDRLAIAEQHAERGEVVVDDVTLHALLDRVEVSTRRGGREGEGAVVASVRVDVRPPEPSRPYPRLSRAVVRQWVLPPVYERMRTGRGEFLSELRPAVPMFVRFGGIDYDGDDDAPALLDAFIRRAQWLIDGHGGNVLQLTLGDKGAYLYAVFGSPLAHEDDSARACAAALDVLALEGETAATGLQVGIAEGRVRSGTYGHRQRRTFCCLGDAVNLAARLMAAVPPGTAYVTAEVARGAATRFSSEELPPMKVKGKAAPIAVRRLTGRAARATGRVLRADRHLVGRAEELDRLVSLADLAFSGNGQVVALAAEAGMGKSSLAAVLAEVVEDRGVQVLVGASVSAGGGSYLVWQSVAMALFGLTGEERSPTEVAARLADALADVDDTLLPRLPLLGPLVGAVIEDNELTAGFDAKLRKSSLESLVLQYLSGLASRGPLAIVLEDCHWIDPLASDLLDVVARAAATLPLLVLLTYRPGTYTTPELDHTTTVELSQLDEASCRAILHARLATLYGTDTAPSTALLQRLIARSEGNPFYLEEVANYLHDRGADPADPEAATLELPTSLATLVLSRIDTLSETSRRTLKVASVVGRDFDVGTLAGAYPDLGTTRQVARHLRSLRAEDLVVLQDSGLDLYSFKHAVIQEVAYESMPFALRSEVHGRVGVWLEATDPDSLDLLAHHFWHSRDEDKKREYLRKAGDAAKRRYANAAAVDYYRRLDPLVDDLSREDVLTHLGGVLGIVGDWTGAQQCYEMALAYATGRGDARAAAWLRIERLTAMRRRGDYAGATEELDRVQPELERLGDLAGVGRSENLRGVIASLTGTYASAWEHLQRSLEIRRTLDEPGDLATTLNNLGITAGGRGEYDVSRHFLEEALAQFAMAGDREHTNQVCNNLGMTAYLQAEYDDATVHLEEAIRLAMQIGAVYTAALARHNLANCARQREDTAMARRRYLEALDVFVTSGDKWACSAVFEDIALLVCGDDPAAALRLLCATVPLRAELGVPRTATEEEALRPCIDSARDRLGDAANGEEQAARSMDLSTLVLLARRLCKPS